MQRAKKGPSREPMRAPWPCRSTTKAGKRLTRKRRDSKPRALLGTRPKLKPQNRHHHPARAEAVAGHRQCRRLLAAVRCRVFLIHSGELTDLPVKLSQQGPSRFEAVRG